MYASTDKLKSKDSNSRLNVLMLAPGFFFVVTLSAVVGTETQDMFPAFLRAKQECAPPVPVNGKCPVGTVFGENTCMPMPRGNPMWSGSAYCASKKAVVSGAVHVQGSLMTLASAIGLVATTFLGTTMVDAVGRKPAMVLSSIGGTLGVSVMFICSLWKGSAGLNLMFVAIFVQNIVNCFDVASWAMASDIAGEDVAKRGVAYGLVYMLRNAGLVIAFAVGYPILNADLTDYSRVFIGIVAFSVLVTFANAAFLRETSKALQSSEEQPLNQASATSGAVNDPERVGAVHVERAWGRRVSEALVIGAKEMLAALRLNVSDKYLFCQLFIGFLTTGSYTGIICLARGYAVGVVGIRQSHASLVGLANHALGIVGALLSAFLTGRVGPFCTVWIGLSLIVVGVFLSGLCAGLEEQTRIVVYCLGWSVLCGLGIGIQTPACMATIGTRAKADVHGKLFAAQLLIGQVGGLVGTLIWPKHLFIMTPGLTWMRGLGFFVASACVLAALILSIANYFAHARSVGDAADPDLAAQKLADTEPAKSARV